MANARVRAVRYPFFPLLLASLASCSDPAVGEQSATSSAAIVGGSPSKADDAVVLMLTHDPAKDTAQGSYYVNCTATFVAPDILLTARHCVTKTTDGTFTCDKHGAIASGAGGTMVTDFAPGETLVFVGAAFPENIAPETAHAKAKSFVHDSAPTTCNADIALVVLDRAIPNAKLAPMRLETGVSLGDRLRVVGWGANETSYFPDVRMTRDGVTVAAVGPSDTVLIGGQLGDKEFTASESVCTGDSGGPALDTSTGAIVGVVSRGQNKTPMAQNGNGCVGTEHTFMLVSKFRALVERAFAVTGEVPWREGEPEPPRKSAVVDAGTDAALEIPPNGASPDAGGPETGVTSPGDSPGCSATSHEPASRGGAFVAGALALVVAARRKRRARGARAYN